jgi:PAS domain S-box-containing protein
MDDKTVPISRRQTAALGPLKPAVVSGPPAPVRLDYRALFEQTADCVFIISFDLKYLAVNPRAAELLGYERDELLGKPLSEIMAMDDSHVDGDLIDHTPGLYERILRRRDGSTLPVEISTSIVNDELGKPLYIQSIARDISDRKEAELTLRNRDRTLSMINHAAVRLLRSPDIERNIPEVLALLGSATGIIKCALVKMDMTPGNHNSIEILAEWLKPGFEPIDLHKVLALLGSDPHTFQEENFLDTRFQIGQAPRSTPVSIAYVPIVDPANVWGFFGIFDARQFDNWTDARRDTIRTVANIMAAGLQRGQFEEKIRASEARSQTLMYALPDLIVRIDEAGYVLDYISRPDHPLNMECGVIDGKTLTDVWGADVVAQLHLEKGKSGPLTWTESALRFPDKPNVFEARMEAFHETGKLIVIRDVSDRARLDQMKSDFINRASHELRTPLTTAILMCDLIRQGGNQQEVDEYWQILSSELNRQKTLVDRLLMAGRLESGTMKLERAPLDLLPVLKESWLAVKAAAQKKQIGLETSLPSQPLMILGDPSGLQQVFINLLFNAIKFSPDGSTIAMRVTSAAGRVHIAIADRGIGIPPEDLPNMFERFFRARNVTFAEIPGSGVGLYIVKSIIEELGGEISLESTLNVGTTFTVTLPVA